jgi:bacterioferritin
VVQNAKKTVPGTRDALIQSLNEDLAREYQSVIASVVYSQVLKGAEYMKIAQELEKLAAQELQHALTIAKQVDHLGGTPIVQPKPVQPTDDNKAMLRTDLVATVIDRH